MKVYVLWCQESDYDWVPAEVRGAYASEELAKAGEHGAMRARNKDGSISFKTNDTRPKVWTPEGCCTVEEFEVQGLEGR